MTMPNFLIIGAAKSGTSSLYKYLGQHPQIYISPIKEPCFLAGGAKKVQCGGPGDQLFHSRVISDLPEFQALFKDVTSETAIGEGSIMYLYSPSAPATIKQYTPDIKMIAILRNPVDRAFSSFSHLRRDGREPIRNFSKALKEENNRINAGWQHLWHYKQLGFYHAQLRRYYDLFRPDQLLIFTFEEFCTDPIKVSQDIFSFLDVSPTFTPDISTKHNVSGIPKSQLLHDFLSQPSQVKKVLKMFFTDSLHLYLRKKIKHWNIDPRTKPTMPSLARHYLLKEYKEDILELQTLTGKDLSKWLII